MSKALKEAEDWHAHQLGEAYLVTRAKRRMLAAERQDPLILEGIPVHLPKRQRTNVVVPPAPPPSEISEVESLLPLTQPSPRCRRTDQFIRIQVQWQSASGRTVILEPI